MTNVDQPVWHGDFERLLAWIDGELSQEQSVEMEVHLGACRSCSMLLTEERGAAATLSRALSALDVPHPRIGVRRLRRRAAGRWLGRAASSAAILVLILAGGVYALVPGARARLRPWMAAWGDGGANTPTTIRSQPDVSTFFSVVAPDSVDVVVTPPADSLVIRVVRTADTHLSVRGPVQWAPASVELGDGRLSLRPASARLLTLVIPRGSRARILSAGRTVLDLRPGVAADGDSTFVVRLNAAEAGPGG